MEGDKIDHMEISFEQETEKERRLLYLNPRRMQPLQTCGGSTKRKPLELLNPFLEMFPTEQVE